MKSRSFMMEDEVTGKAYDARLARRLFQYLRPYLIFVFLGTLCLLASSACQLAGPYLVMVGIDKYILPGKLEGFLTLIIIYLLVITGDFIFRFAQIYVTNYLGQKTMYDLRMDLFSHLQKLSLRFFDRNPVGRLVTRATSDLPVPLSPLTSSVALVSATLSIMSKIRNM